MFVLAQEPHPVRLSQEEVEKKKAQQDSCPLNMFEHLSDLKSFFVEVHIFTFCWSTSPNWSSPSWTKSLLLMFQGISDNVSLVKAVVPKNQSRSFITQGSPDTMVSLSTFYATLIWLIRANAHFNQAGTFLRRFERVSVWATAKLSIIKPKSLDKMPTFWYTVLMYCVKLWREQ